jgi:transcriptional regulator with PAS, ATPase and Fis domain
VVHLKLPPLRQRAEDIPLLVDGFIHKMNTIKDCLIDGIAPDALALLMSHNYPGNIRELENIIEHAFVVCRKGTINKAHLPQNLLQKKSPPAESEVIASAPRESLPPVRAAERKVIIEALKTSGFNRKITAQKLGMHKSTLYRKMHKLNIELPAVDGRSINMIPK